jgi:hypothetical protein
MSPQHKTNAPKNLIPFYCDKGNYVFKDERRHFAINPNVDFFLHFIYIYKRSSNRNKVFLENICNFLIRILLYILCYAFNTFKAKQ